MLQMYDIITMKKCIEQRVALTLELLFVEYCEAKEKKNFMQMLYFSW